MDKCATAILAVPGAPFRCVRGYAPNGQDGRGTFVPGKTVQNQPFETIPSRSMVLWRGKGQPEGNLARPQHDNGSCCLGCWACWPGELRLDSRNRFHALVLAGTANRSPNAWSLRRPAFLHRRPFLSSKPVPAMTWNCSWNKSWKQGTGPRKTSSGITFDRHFGIARADASELSVARTVPSPGPSNRTRNDREVGGCPEADTLVS